MGTQIRVVIAGVGLAAVIGLFGAASVSHAQVVRTSEDGVAVVLPDATFGKGKLKVKVACVESPSNVPCYGYFRLAVEKKWAFATGSFSAIPSGTSKSFVLIANKRTRKYMRNRCSAKTRASVTQLEPNQLASGADRGIATTPSALKVVQHPVKVARKPSDCRALSGDSPRRR